MPRGKWSLVAESELDHNGGDEFIERCICFCMGERVPTNFCSNDEEMGLLRCSLSSRSEFEREVKEGVGLWDSFLEHGGLIKRSL